MKNRTENVKECDATEADKRTSAGNKIFNQTFRWPTAWKEQKINKMAQVKSGDTVRVHYTGKLTSGEQFDSSAGREPLEFTVGAGQMIKGFDAAMPGMSVGEKKTVNIAPEEAYGHKDEEAIIEFPKKSVPPDMPLEVGMKLELRNENGQPFPVTVADIKDDVIILDANHSLAGKELIFDIELVEIV